MKTKKLTKVTSVVLALLMALSVMCVAPLTADAAGNTQSNATAYTLGTWVNGNITKADYVDWYKINLTKSGAVKLTIEAEFNGIVCDFTDGSGKSVSYEVSTAIYNGTPTVPAEKTLQFNLTKGTYYLKLSQYPNHSDKDYGKYRFIASFTSANVSFEESQGGSNNTKDTANAINLNQTYKGQIAVNDFSDWYKLTLSNAGKLELTVNANYESAHFALYDAQNKSLYDGYAGSANSKTASLDVTKGTYYLNLNQNDYNKLFKFTGNYDFKFKFTSANVSFEEPQGGSNNTKDTANAINLNQTYKGQIAQNDSSDWYKLNVPSAGKVKLAMTSSLVSCLFTLYDSNDKCLKDTYVGTNQSSAYKTLELDLAAGNYYLSVSGTALNTGNYSFTFTKVLPSPTSVKLNRGTLGLGVGEAYGLVKTVSPSNANQAVSWTSSNSSVASVDANGKVTGKKAGSATVTVKTANGLTASCNVTVKAAPTSVKTNPASLTLGQGETYTISESTSAGSYANAANLRWSTSDANVVKVAKQNGTNKATLTAAGTGTATVTIKIYNGLTAQCKVTVKPAPSSVSTNPASVTLGNGETYTIAENTNAGSYANAANLKWSSSNTKVATVTKGSGNKAVVKAVGKGTANVTIRLYNGKTATCKVTVKDAPKTVSITKSSLTLKKGQSYTVAENTNAGSYANAANLKWSSSNNKVATVTKGSGNKATIKAVGKGTANVTIRLYNGKTATCKVTVK